jgi:glycosyltransferase involved in cell wall biosynthesis
VDILHSLGYVGPILSLHKHLITIHDANFVRLSHLMSPLKRIIYGLIVRLSAKTCSHVVTISAFSKAELEECLGLPGSRVSVVLSGAPTGSPCAEPTDLTGTFASHQPYILVLGGGSPHKNIRAFVQAFSSVAECFPHKLLIAGRLNDALDDLQGVPQLIQSGRIIITGFLDEAELDRAYRGAALYAFPTLYEGFGLPLLEAQARGVPVLCSQIASLPELGGDSVAYLDPTSLKDMAKQMKHLLNHPDRLQDLATRGKVNVQRFTWEETGTQTWALYRQILG